MRQSDRLAALSSIERDLSVLQERMPRAFRNLADWSALGYPASTLNGEGRGNDHDAVGRLVVAGLRDDFRTDEVAADGVLGDVRAGMAWLARFAFRNTEASPMQTKALVECGNPHCDNYVTGLGNDRLRDGRCLRCYHHRRRHGDDWPTKRVALDGS